MALKVVMNNATSISRLCFNNESRLKGLKNLQR